MIDMGGLVTGWLRSDTGVMTAFDDAVFCDEVPAAHDGVLALVRAVNTFPAANPTLAAHVYVVQIDVEGVPGGDGALPALVSLIQSRLHGLPGSHTAGVVNAVTIGPAIPGVTDSDSPARPRWVLTVDVTGRSN